MSQFALLLITDEQTIDAACRGWAPPLAEPIKKTMLNPFSNQVTEVVSYIPEEFEENPDAAGQYDVHDALKNAQPIAIDFQVVRALAPLFESATPYRITRNDEGFPLTLDRVPADDEQKIVECFADQLGEYADAEVRRAKNLSMFVYVYDT